MKTFNSLIIVTAITTSAIFGSGEAHSYREHYVRGEDGIRKTVKKPVDPTTVDPALIDEEVSEALLAEMREKLNQLANTSMNDIKPAKLVLPDYDVASKLLRIIIRNNIVDYFNDLEVIKKEVVSTLSELLALKRLADEELDRRGLLHEQYNIDVKNKIPVLNNKINKIYKKSLSNLYNLGGMAVVPVKTSKKGQFFTDAFYDTHETNFNKGIYSICKTSLCLKKLESDLESWHSFVRNFNNTVDFVDFQGTKTVWTKKDVNSTPFITMAFVDAAKDLLSVKLEKNKDYSVAGVLAKGAEVLKGPAGIATLVLAAPVYVFEKTGHAIAQILSFKVMKVKLSLDAQKEYSQKVVFEGMRKNVRDYADHYNSATYVADNAESAIEIAKRFREALDVARKLEITVMNKFSAIELVQLHEDKIIDLRESLRYLSPDRLQFVENKLPQDLKVHARNIIYKRYPEKLFDLPLDEIISYLRLIADHQGFSVQFIAMLNKIKTTNIPVMDKFSVSELVRLHDEKIIDLRESLKYLSKERLLFIENKLPQDFKVHARNLIYQTIPEKLFDLPLDEIISYFRSIADRQETSVQFTAMLNKIKTTNTPVMDKFSVSDLVRLHDEKIIDLRESLKYLSKERLLFIENKLPQDLKVHAWNLIYHTNTEKIFDRPLDEIISYLRSIADDKGVSDQFMAMLSKAKAQNTLVMDKFSVSDLIRLHDEKIVDLRESLKHLSKERFQFIENNLPYDLRVYAHLLTYEANPKKLLNLPLNEIIFYLRLTNEPSKFRDVFDKKTADDILRAAPDLIKKFNLVIINTRNFGFWAKNGDIKNSLLFDDAGLAQNLTSVCWNNQIENNTRRVPFDIAGSSIIIHWEGVDAKPKMVLSDTKMQDKLSYSWNGSNPSLESMKLLANHFIRPHDLLGEWDISDTQVLHFEMINGKLYARVIIWNAPGQANELKEVDILRNIVVIHWEGRNSPSKMHLISLDRNNLSKLTYLWNCGDEKVANKR